MQLSSAISISILFTMDSFLWWLVCFCPTSLSRTQPPATLRVVPMFSSLTICDRVFREANWSDIYWGSLLPRTFLAEIWTFLFQIFERIWKSQIFTRKELSTLLVYGQHENNSCQFLQISVLTWQRKNLEISRFSKFPNKICVCLHANRKKTRDTKTNNINWCGLIYLQGVYTLACTDFRVFSVSQRTRTSP